MSITTVVSPSSSRYPEHAPPASCQEGDLPNTLSLIFTGAYPALCVGLREGVCRGDPLGAEHEGKLALGSEVPLGGAEGRAGLWQVECAELVLVKEAVL